MSLCYLSVHVNRGLMSGQYVYECELLADWADKLTQMGRGKHHLGDFLPPEELEKFMETYTVSSESLELVMHSALSKVTAFCYCGSKALCLVHTADKTRLSCLVGIDGVN